MKLRTACRGRVSVASARNLIFIAAVLQMCLQPAFAQQAKVPIYISAKTNDNVGEQLVYEIREALSASNQMSVALTDADSAFQLNIVTLDPYASTDRGAPSATVYSLVLTMHDPTNHALNIFIDEWVGTCGNVQLQGCATSMIAGADSDIMGFLGALKQRTEFRQQ